MFAQMTVLYCEGSINTMCRVQLAKSQDIRRALSTLHGEHFIIFLFKLDFRRLPGPVFDPRRRETAGMALYPRQNSSFVFNI